MGRYTVLDDPLVDQTIKRHLQRAVEAILNGMVPRAIILRGSFGRGEGSVLVQQGKLRFLSDYEIDVATVSPLHRSLFAQLSGTSTAESGVETSLRWVRPDYLSRQRVGLLPMGPAPPTISLYESRYGSRTLYGEDIVGAGPVIDPRQIVPVSAIILVLNRMAESLYYLPPAQKAGADHLETYYWVNKMILACAEALLLLWAQFHYSYAERGRRFAAAPECGLAFLGPQGDTLRHLVAQATEFKLRPRCSLHERPIRETWMQLIPICGAVLRHLTEQMLGFRFECYAEYPEQFLRYAAEATGSLSRLQVAALKLLDVYKHVRRHRLPRSLLMPFRASSLVFAVVPLVFVGWACSGEAQAALVTQARHQLGRIDRLKSPKSEPQDEWEALRHHTLWAWKNFCYL